uniref:DUF1534 domain-containing protein n=1 Tax=Steinernema glaseri TaxID=37863 RepID=A0A1I7Y789_9BILA
MRSDWPARTVGAPAKCGNRTEATLARHRPLTGEGAKTVSSIRGQTFMQLAKGDWHRHLSNGDKQGHTCSTASE